MLTVQGKISLRPRNARNVSISNGDIEIEIMGFPKNEGKNASFRNTPKVPAARFAIKRPYSTMSETNSLGITLTEYKHASKFTNRFSISLLKNPLQIQKVSSNTLWTEIGQRWSSAKLNLGKQSTLSVGWMNIIKSTNSSRSWKMVMEWSNLFPQEMRWVGLIF